MLNISTRPISKLPAPASPPRRTSMQQASVELLSLFSDIEVSYINNNNTGPIVTSFDSMLADPQALNAIVATADAQRPAENDLFSPRSTAAMALSSLSSSCFAGGPPGEGAAVQEQEDQQRQQRPPAALFQSHAESAPTCKSHSKEPVLPSAAESRKPTPTTQPKAPAVRPRAALRKEPTPPTNRQPKAPAVKSAMKKRGSDSVSSNSSSGSLRSVSMRVPPPVQHQQYAMLPVQYVPTAAYTVHHPDFFPPGASTTAIPWTPHSGSADGGRATLYPRAGQHHHAGRGPTPPSAHHPRMPSPPTAHQHGPSPPAMMACAHHHHQQHHGPSPTTSGVLLHHHHHHHSGPSPSSSILHRPSPPLRGTPPTFAGVTPHQHHHSHHHHHGSGYNVTWQYPPPQPKYYYAATPSAPRTVTSASTAQTPSPPTEAAAAAPVPNEVHSTLSSAVTPTSHKKQKTTGAVAKEVTSSGGSSGSKKKQGQPGYERKKKSLGLLAETFVSEFPPTPSGLTGEELIVDELSTKLDVERRRIYDVVNILESLRLVVKRGKNTYHWMGKEHLDRQFALLQNEAIEMWPEEALQNGLTTERLEARSKDNGNSEPNKSLTRLSQLFVQVFLVGYDTVNLPQASDIIQGFASTTDKLAELGCRRGQAVPKDPIQLQAAAARGLKTKIRRLYDIANVFLSVGLLVRIEAAKSDSLATRRPHYQWNYPESVHDIRTKVWPTLTETQKRDQVPFDEVQTRAMLKIGLNPRQYVHVPQHQQPCSSNNSFLGKDSKVKAKRKASELLLSSSSLSSSVLANDAVEPSAKKNKTDEDDAQVEQPPASPDKQQSARRVSFPTSGEEKHQTV